MSRSKWMIEAAREVEEALGLIGLDKLIATAIEKHCPSDKAEKLVEALRGIKDMAKRYGTVSGKQPISKEQYGGRYGIQTVGEYQWALRQLSMMADTAIADYEELNK